MNPDDYKLKILYECRHYGLCAKENIIANKILNDCQECERQNKYIRESKESDAKPNAKSIAIVEKCNEERINEGKKPKRNKPICSGKDDLDVKPRFSDYTGVNKRFRKDGGA